MPCIDACGSPIEKQGVRSGGREGAEPPHQRMSNPCVEDSTSRPVSVEQGPFADRELIEGLLSISGLLLFACFRPALLELFWSAIVTCQSPVMPLESLEACVRQLLHIVGLHVSLQELQRGQGTRRMRIPRPEGQNIPSPGGPQPMQGQPDAPN